MEKVVHFGVEEVYDVREGKQRYDSFFVRKGPGRGVLESGQIPSFDDKVQQFDALIESGVKLPLGGVNKEGKPIWEAMSARDLKCRYNGHKLTFGSLQNIFDVYIGPTSWQECRQDYNRSEEDAQKLQEFGFKQHGDRGYYFSQGLGATLITLTREGNAIVGIRSSDSYDGAIHGAAGWMKFDRGITKVHPYNDAYRELKEELGIQPEFVTIKLIGLVAYPKTLEADFVYVARTDKPTEYITSGAWKEAVDAREHKDLVVLRNPDQVHRLLEEGKIPLSKDNTYEVLPSTTYGLEVLAEHWNHFTGKR